MFTMIFVKRSKRLNNAAFCAGVGGGGVIAYERDEDARHLS